MILVLGDESVAASGKEDLVQAKIGDRIVVKGHRTSDPDRDCEVIEVHGIDGGPPYLVRWADSEHETLFFPGSDASVAQPDTTK